MNEQEKQKQIAIEISNTINLNVLGLDVWPMANHVRVHPDESPLTLVYESENGKFESDKKIREDLSNLIGFEINYRKDGSNHETTAIILFSTINEKDLLSMGTHKTITIGKVRKLAESIHPFAKIVNEKIATTMWQCASDFYTMKFMLGKKHFEFPGIMSMSSCEESVSNEESIIKHKFARGKWNYNLNKTEIRVKLCSTIWCYIDKE
jgi:hypothetical protein